MPKETAVARFEVFAAMLLRIPVFRNLMLHHGMSIHIDVLNDHNALVFKVKQSNKHSYVAVLLGLLDLKR